jgi:hypothetical protein
MENRESSHPTGFLPLALFKGKGGRGDRDLEPPISIILILPILLRNFGTRIHTKKLEPRMMRIIANEE